MKKWFVVLFSIGMLFPLAGLAYAPPKPAYNRAVVTSSVMWTNDGVMIDDAESLMQIQRMIGSFTTKLDPDKMEIPAGGTNIRIVLERLDGSLKTVFFVSDRHWVVVDGVNYACKESDFEAMENLMKTAPKRTELIYWETWNGDRSRTGRGFCDDPEAAKQLLGMIQGLSPRTAKLDWNDRESQENGGISVYLYSGEQFVEYTVTPVVAVRNSWDTMNDFLESSPELFANICDLLQTDRLYIPKPKKLSVLFFHGLGDEKAKIITDPDTIGEILKPLRGMTPIESNLGFCGIDSIHLTLDDKIDYTIHSEQNTYVYSSKNGMYYYMEEKLSQSWLDLIK